MTFPRPPDELPAPNLRSIRGIFVGLRCRAFEGLVDTAAEDAVMGSHALRALREELSTVGLQPLRVTGQQSIPCAGIGGDAVIQEVEDVPTCIAGLLGIIRFSVVQDSETMATPPLIPISYLEAVGAIIDVANNQYTTTDGYSAPLRRLPSGHRAINMLAFHMTPWVLPRAQRVNGRDPFQLDPEVAEHPPSPPSSPDGPPSSQRFSKGSKSRGGPRSYSGVSVGHPPTVAAPSGPSRVLASQFYAPEATVELEEMEPMELIEEEGAMNENNETEELVFEEEGESAEMTSEGMESPPLPVIPETSVFPVPAATPERPNPEDRVVVMQTRESDGMTAHEAEHHGEHEMDSVEEGQPGSRRPRLPSSSTTARSDKGTGKGDDAPWEEEGESETHTRDPETEHPKGKSKSEFRTAYARPPQGPKSGSSGSRPEPYGHKGKGKGLGSGSSSSSGAPPGPWRSKGKTIDLGRNVTFGFEG